MVGTTYTDTDAAPHYRIQILQYLMCEDRICTTLYVFNEGNPVILFRYIQDISTVSSYIRLDCAVSDSIDFDQQLMQILHILALSLSIVSHTNDREAKARVDMDHVESPAAENDDIKESPRMSPQAGEPTHRDPESIQSPPESSQPLSPIPLKNALGLVFDQPFDNALMLDDEECTWDFDDFRIRLNMGDAS